MDAQLQTIFEYNNLNAYQVALISVCVSVLTFLLTNWIKNYFENNLLRRNLVTEHTFDQRKKIKEALAKYKVHLLTACEDLNHRLYNFSTNHNKNWIKVDGRYEQESYFFHSTVYKFLSVFAWVNKINKEMIYLDTTIASKEDMEFIKFLKVFPVVMCDLTFIVGKDADGDYAVDHFFRTNFEILPESILEKDGIKSYAEYKKSIPELQNELESLYVFLDGISPNEDRMRWDRLHLLHLTLILFLNNYGYDFQQTNSRKLVEVFSVPKKSKFIGNYFGLLKEYRLGENKGVKHMEKIAQ